MENKIKNFKEFVNESFDGNPQDFAKEIEKTIKDIFPQSFVSAKYSDNLGESITIRFGLGNKDEWNHGYIENDPVHHILFIWLGSQGNDRGTSDLGNLLKVELSVGGSLKLYTNRNIEKIKFGWRTTTGSPEKIIEHLKKYFMKVKSVLKENEDKLPVNYKKYIK